jgi:hypothetical protein
LCDQNRRIGVATEKLHGNDTGKTLSLNAGAGIGAQWCRLVNLDHSIDLARIVRLESDLRHLANAQAVEKHVGTPPKARDFVVEEKANFRLIGAAAATEPINEPEQRSQNREGEQSNQRMTSSRFHGLDSFPFA